MRKSLVLEALILYGVMAVLLVGLVQATYMQDEDTKTGTYTRAKSFVSADFVGGKLHYPFFRSRASGSTPGKLIMEFYWITWPGGIWEHLIAFDDDGDDSIMIEDNYLGEPVQILCRTRAGYEENGNYTWDTGWAEAAIPLTP